MAGRRCLSREDGPGGALAGASERGGRILFDAATNSEVHKFDVVRIGDEDLRPVDIVCNAQTRDITASALAMWTMTTQSGTSQLAAQRIVREIMSVVIKSVEVVKSANALSQNPRIHPGRTFLE
jgi:hypothetical protein